MYNKPFLYICVCIMALLGACSNTHNDDFSKTENEEISLELKIENISSDNENTTRAVSHIDWEYKIHNMAFIYYENGVYAGAKFFTEGNLPVTSNNSANITITDYLPGVKIGATNNLYFICNFTNQTDEAAALNQLFNGNYTLANFYSQLNNTLPSNNSGLYESSDFLYGIPMYGILNGLEKYNKCDIKRSVARLQFNAAFSGKTITLKSEHFKKISFLNNENTNAISTNIESSKTYYIAPNNMAVSSDFNTNNPCIIMSVKNGIKYTTEYYRIDFWRKLSKEYIGTQSNTFYVFNINSLDIRGYATYEEALSNPGSNINLKDEFTNYQFYNGQYYIKLTCDPGMGNINGNTFNVTTGWTYNSSAGSYANKISTCSTGLSIETNIPSNISINNFETAHNYTASRNALSSNNVANGNQINQLSNLTGNIVTATGINKNYIRYYLDKTSINGNISTYSVNFIERGVGFILTARQSYGPFWAREYRTAYYFEGDMNFTLGNIDFSIHLNKPQIDL